MILCCHPLVLCGIECFGIQAYNQMKALDNFCLLFYTSGLFSFTDPDLDSDLDSDPIPVVGSLESESESDSV